MTKGDLHIDKNSNGNLTNRILDAIHKMNVPHLVSKEEAWLSLSYEINNSRQIEESYFNWKTPVAAAIALLITFSSILYFSSVSITTMAGEHQSLLLPDGSKVELNADSEIKYNRLLWNWERKVKMNGEAFIEVEKGSQFNVHSNNGVVKVLGTGFNIYDRGSDYSVSCYHGSVSVVTTIHKDETILTKGKLTSLSGDTLSEPITFDVYTQAPWVQGKFLYNNKSVKDVFNELERQFGVKIVYNEKTDRKYTGEFNNKNLNTALEMVCKPMRMNHYTIENRIIITE